VTFSFKSLTAYGIFPVIALGGIVLTMKHFPASPQTQIVTQIPGESQLGDHSFRLTNASGELTTDQNFLGRVRLVFFGFTHCPDICPLGLTKMNEVLDRLGKDREKVAPIFITVDPQRDTPDKLKDFLGNFSKDFIGLTGSQDEISTMLASYKAYARKQPSDSHEDYRVDHSSFIYIMDPKGAYSAHVTPEVDTEIIVAHVRKHLS
jgi:protein SCO1/2